MEERRGSAADARPDTWQGKDPFEGDGTVAHGARQDRPVAQAYRCLVQRLHILPSLREQGRHLGTLVGDGRALWVVLVVGRCQLGSLDDAGEALLQPGDLHDHPSTRQLDGGSHLGGIHRRHRINGRSASNRYGSRHRGGVGQFGQVRSQPTVCLDVDPARLADPGPGQSRRHSGCSQWRRTTGGAAAVRQRDEHGVHFRRRRRPTANVSTR